MADRRIHSAFGFLCSTLLLGACWIGCAADDPTRGGLGDGTDAPSSAGDEVFDDTIVHQIVLDLDPQDWQAIIDAAAAYVNDNADYPYFPARATFDGEPLEGDIGVRLKGHISIELSAGHAFPLKLDFDRYEDGFTLDGLERLNLHTNFNGPTLPILRDYLSYEAWRRRGVAASRTAFAEVTVNDEALGTYVLVEQVDGDFLRRHFGAPYGDLYKPEQRSGSLEYRGPDIDDYPDIGHKWPDASDHAALLHALEVLESGTIEQIGAVFDIEGVLTYLAGNVVLGSGDYYANTGHNYYLYEATPGRFTMLPWDMNGSQEAEGLSVCSPTTGYLSAKLLADAGCLEMYLDILADFLGDTGSAAWLTTRLDGAQQLLGPALPAEEVEGLRRAIASRTGRLAAEWAGTTACR